MRPIAILLSVLLFCNECLGQGKQLRTGDKVPDVVLTPLNEKAFQLSDYRGQLVILDFWGIHCTACIKAMPEMQSLQRRFQGKLKIIMVTRDDSFAVRKLFSRLSVLNSIDLTSITNDSTLSPLFYYASLPTHVWIDEEGKVIQKTAGYNTSALLVQQRLAGKQIYLPEKKEDEDYQKGVPLFVEGGGRQVNRFKYYSLIMKSPDGLDGLTDLKTERDASSKVIRVLRSNVPLMDLYCYAYAEGDSARQFIYDRARRIILTDSAHIFEFPFDRSKVAGWKDRYLLSYELKIPPDCHTSIYKIMQQDLQRFFGYEARVQKEN